MNSKPEGEWKLFQTVALRKFIKRIMRPRTRSEVYRSKLYMSVGYLLCTMALLHRIAFRGIQQTSGKDIEKAVNLNITDAKIIRVQDGRFKEIVEYRREDYPELIENRPSYARE